MIKKIAEVASISVENLVSIDHIKAKMAADDVVSDRFTKITAMLRDAQTKTAKATEKNGRKVAPRVEDFLYASAIIIHAAEAALIDQDTGEPIKNAKGEAVRGWYEITKDTRGSESVRWVSPDDIKPYKNCFTPDTFITMADGSVKEIQDVSVGDEVITHLGNVRKVSKVYITPWDEDLLRFSVRNGRKIHTTPNHPFYVADLPQKIGDSNWRPRIAVGRKNELAFKFEEASSLLKYDLLTSPQVSGISPDVVFTIDQARALGLFAAEGSFGKKYGRLQSAVFTYGLHEKQTLALETMELLKRVFPEGSVSSYEVPQHGSVVVSITGKGVCSFFYDHIGEYSDQKRLSKSVVYSAREAALAFIGGWLDGDGCLDETDDCTIGVSSSTQMANQISFMLNNNSIHHSLFFKKGGEVVRFPSGQESIRGDSYRIEICSSAARNILPSCNRLDLAKKAVFGNRNKNSFRQGYRFYSITKSDVVHFKGMVYNLEVEGDNSYLANSVAVHNCNHDIFPEEDIVKAYKDWIGKPLCRDHVSSTVDGVRGIVVDTYYDPKFKRVHALFALDRKNYPDLARKVEAGYATCVSMGTAVGRAICSDCGNVATVEAEYCVHSKTKSAYGEVNKDLSPIELSIVVTGADPRAKIKTVIASLQGYVDRKEQEFAKLAKSLKLGEDPSIKADMDAIGQELAGVKDGAEKLVDEEQDDQTLEDLAKQMRRLNIDGHKEVVDLLLDRAAQAGNIGKDRVAKLLALIDVGDTQRIEKAKALLKPQTEAVKVPATENRDRVSVQDSAGYGLNQEVGDELFTGDLLPVDHKPPPTEPMAAFMSFYQSGVEKVGNKAAAQTTHNGVNRLEKQVENLFSKINRLEAAVSEHKEKPMNFAELKERSLKRRTAYHQGTEPSQKYPPLGDADKIRNTQDKQMVGDELDTSADCPDLKEKELHQRASLEERQARRAALVETAKQASVKSGAGEVKTYKQDGKDVKTVMGPDGKEKVLTQAADDGAEKTDTKPQDKKAYWQGTEAPAPGKLKYAPMGNADQIRNTQDKQMSGQGMESGADGMHPGYGKSDEAVKKYWQRLATLKAKRSLGQHIKQAKWDLFADDKKVMTVNATDVYDNFLDEKVTETDSDQTYGEFFISQAYGEELVKLLRQAAGPEGAAMELGLPPAAVEQAGAAGAEEPGGLDEARDKVLESLSAIEDAVEDVRQTLGVDGLKDVSVDVAPDAEVGEAPAALAQFDGGLIKVYAALADAADELDTLGTELTGGNTDVLAVVAETLADADDLVAHAREQIETFAAKKKKKEDEPKGKKDDKADKAKKDEKSKQKLKDEKSDKNKAKDEKAKKDEKADKAKKDDKAKKKKSADQILAEMLQARADRREKLVAEAIGEIGPEDPTLVDEPPIEGDDVIPVSDEDLELEQDEELNQLLAEIGHEAPAYDNAAMDDGMCVIDVPEMAAKDQMALDKGEKKETKEIAGKEVDKHEADPKMHDHDESKEKLAARKAWREAVAAKAISDLNSTYQAARPGKGEVVKFDAKVSDELNLVENLATQQAKDLDVATSQPRNVRMAADALNGLIAKGAVKPEEIDDLVAKGAVDADAAKYWKQFYGQAADGGKDFAAGMVKEYKQSKQASVAADEAEVRDIKLRRAYSLGLDAQKHGIISNSRAELERYVDSVVHLPDHVFEHVKNVVAQHKPQKVATAALAPTEGKELDGQLVVEASHTNGNPSVADLARLFG